eukprot:549334-Amphidinium_carterae.1
MVCNTGQRRRACLRTTEVHSDRHMRRKGTVYKPANVRSSRPVAQAIQTLGPGVRSTQRKIKMVELIKASTEVDSIVPFPFFKTERPTPKGTFLW